MTTALPKLILLDCYGIVMSRGYPDTVAELHKKYGVDARRSFDVMYTKYFNRAAVRAITQKEAWERSVQELALPMTSRELAQLHFSLMRVNHDILREVRRLRRHYRVILLTKNTRSQFQWVSNRFPELRKAFSRRGLLNTWEYKLPKASEKTIRFISKRYGAKPEEMLYLEDQEKNLREPRVLGVHGVLCKTSREAIQILRDLA